jgi:hypothetical protein
MNMNRVSTGIRTKAKDPLARVLSLGEKDSNAKNC